MHLTSYVTRPSLVHSQLLVPSLVDRKGIKTQRQGQGQRHQIVWPLQPNLVEKKKGMTKRGLVTSLHLTVSQNPRVCMYSILVCAQIVEGYHFKYGVREGALLLPCQTPE